MVIIQFESADSEKKALGWLPGRFAFKTWSNGDLMLHENVLPFLAREGIAFKVKGPASYEHFLPAIRTADSAAVQ
jgi:hypothetical protein